MTRRFTFACTCLAWLLVATPSLPAAEGEPGFNTVKVEGRNYVNLADFIRYYQFDSKWQQDDLRITLTSKYRKFIFTMNSRECSLNSVLLWLNDAPIEHRNSILISEIDVIKTLHPVLRQWLVPRRRVKTIMIDPGHGGEDRGTLGYRRSQEKWLTVDLAVRVEKLLRKAGFRTLMTRRKDSYVSLEDRAELANSSEADLFLSLHFNSSKPNAQPSGIETYCLTPSGLSSTGSIRRRLGLGDFGAERGNRFDPHNMMLAYIIQQKLLKAIPEATDRGVKRARFVVLSATELPAVLVENGFLSNSSEEKRILTVAYRERLAGGIVEGVKRYAELMNAKTSK